MSNGTVVPIPGLTDEQTGVVPIPGLTGGPASGAPSVGLFEAGLAQLPAEQQQLTAIAEDPIERIELEREEQRRLREEHGQFATAALQGARGALDALLTPGALLGAGIEGVGSLTDSETLMDFGRDLGESAQGSEALAAIAFGGTGGEVDAFDSTRRLIDEQERAYPTLSAATRLAGAVAPGLATGGLGLAGTGGRAALAAASLEGAGFGAQAAFEMGGTTNEVLASTIMGGVFAGGLAKGAQVVSKKVASDAFGGKTAAHLRAADAKETAEIAEAVGGAQGRILKKISRATTPEAREKALDKALAEEASRLGKKAASYDPSKWETKSPNAVQKLIFMRELLSNTSDALANDARKLKELVPDDNFAIAPKRIESVLKKQRKIDPASAPDEVTSTTKLQSTIKEIADSAPSGQVARRIADNMRGVAGSMNGKTFAQSFSDAHDLVRLTRAAERPTRRTTRSASQVRGDLNFQVQGGQISRSAKELGGNDTGFAFRALGAEVQSDMQLLASRAPGDSARQALMAMKRLDQKIAAQKMPLHKMFSETHSLARKLEKMSARSGDPNLGPWLIHVSKRLRNRLSNDGKLGSAAVAYRKLIKEADDAIEDVLDENAEKWLVNSAARIQQELSSESFGEVGRLYRQLSPIADDSIEVLSDAAQVRKILRQGPKSGGISGAIDGFSSRVHSANQAKAAFTGAKTIDKSIAAQLSALSQRAKKAESAVSFDGGPIITIAEKIRNLGFSKEQVSSAAITAGGITLGHAIGGPLGAFISSLMIHRAHVLLPDLVKSGIKGAFKSGAKGAVKGVAGSLGRAALRVPKAVAKSKPVGIAATFAGTRTARILTGKAVAQMTVSDQSDLLERRREEIQTVISQNDLSPVEESVAALGNVPMGAQVGVALAYQQKLTRLQADLPKPVQSTRGPLPLSRQDVRLGNAMYEATVDPLSLFDDFADGQLDPDKAEYAWRQWPGLRQMAILAVNDMIYSQLDDEQRASIPDATLTKLDYMLGMGGQLQSSVSGSFSGVVDELHAMEQEEREESTRQAQGRGLQLPQSEPTFAQKVAGV